jgi:hypothetical protein
MNFNMPMAVFGGLALIAAAIYFGPDANDAQSGVQRVAVCDTEGKHCADIRTAAFGKKDSLYVMDRSD